MPSIINLWCTTTYLLYYKSVFKGRDVVTAVYIGVGNWTQKYK